MIDTQRSQPSDTQLIMPELEIPGLRILKEIGRGGMARVYLAMQESLQRPVAVKLLDNPDTPGFHERFMNEGRYLAALSHSNIVDVFDVGESEGKYYIVMEYLPGGDLKRRIQRGMTPGMALKVAVRIAGCLDYLHEKGIVHRDLKPSNILFRADSNPVITDFGIAKLLRDRGDLTMGGSILGSPSYLSPEQAGFAGEVDGRSDLYSLGVILYEMLTGERPYKGENFAAIIMAHHKDPIPKLPGSLFQYQSIIERLLSKSMEERYPNGMEMIQAVRGLFTDEIHHLPGWSEQGAAQYPAVKAQVEEQLIWNSGRSWFRDLLIIVLLFSADVLLPFDDLQLEPAVGEVTSEPALSTAYRPSATQRPDKPQLNDLDQLLRLAYKRMDSLRLSYPKGDSAYDYFQEILKLDPDNKAAKAGIRQIVRWYIDKAEQALSENNVKRAKSYISRGKNINQSHPRLIALQNRLQAPASASEKTFGPFERLGY